MSSHIPSVFDHSLGGYAMVARKPARRLVVFVHGWRGNAYNSWGDFDTPPNDDWWGAADLLFVEYPSTSESVTASADRMRKYLRDFYPLPNKLMLVSGDFAAREDRDTPYEELVLVGHSLGGLVVRRALVDSIDEWKFDGFPDNKRPMILDASVRLFSPASAGFLPRGLLGAFKEAPIWWLVEMFLSSGAYPDLKQDSVIIRETRARTEIYKGDSRAHALSTSILWANPERVVITERYSTDARTRTADGTTHATVCKPTDEYNLPYQFVESGLIE